MVKKLKPTMYHSTICLFSKRHVQIAKVIEELEELKEALSTKDIFKILEELADVENVLPYLILIYMPKEKIEIRFTGEYDYNIICDILTKVICLYNEHPYNAHAYVALKVLTKFLAESLYNIYQEYNLHPSDVDAVIDSKRARTIKRKFKEIL